MTVQHILKSTRGFWILFVVEGGFSQTIAAPLAHTRNVETLSNSIEYCLCSLFSTRYQMLLRPVSISLVLSVEPALAFQWVVLLEVLENWLSALTAVEVDWAQVLQRLSRLGWNLSPREARSYQVKILTASHVVQANPVETVHLLADVTLSFN